MNGLHVRANDTSNNQGTGTNLRRVSTRQPANRLNVRVRGLFLYAGNTRRVIATTGKRATRNYVYVTVSPNRHFIRNTITTNDRSPRFFPTLPNLLHDNVNRLPNVANIVYSLGNVFFQHGPYAHNNGVSLLQRHANTVNLAND